MKSRTAGTNAFTEFCLLYGPSGVAALGKLPIAEVCNRVELFSVWLQRTRGLRPSSLQQYVSCARHLVFALRGETLPPLRTNVILRLARDAETRPTLEKAPVTIGMLRAVLRMARAGARPAGAAYVSPAVAVAILFAFQFFMRVSEYARTSPAWPTRALKQRDIRLLGRNVRITLHARKNNQHHFPFEFERGPPNDSSLDLSALYRSYIRWLPPAQRDQPDAPAFRHRDGRPITQEDVAAAVAAAARACSAPPEKFGTHSLRIGAATAAYRQGLSLTWIMQQGFWKSKKGLLRYLRGLPGDHAGHSTTLLHGADPARPAVFAWH